MTRPASSALAALALALATAGPAASQEHDGARQAPAAAGARDSLPPASARIGFDAFRPQRLDVLTGESVRWTNESSRAHTVTADDASFDSGRLTAAQTYVQRFAAPGEAPYHCTLHPLMRGVVGVHQLLLDAPAQAATANRPFSLAGRAALPAGTPISLQADSGSGFAEVATSTVGEDGRFAARFVARAAVSLRAVAGGVTSRSVALLVVDRRIGLRVTPARHGRITLRADVRPAARGGRVVLQLYLPERFGWWPVRRAKLDGRSGATFSLRPRRRLRARVRYTLADGATALATSRTVRIGRAARRAPARQHG
ncbi:MAG: hypothetical protein ACLGI5_00400 [Thermoleophilia bacterium]